MSFLEGIKAIPGDIGSVPTGRGKLKRAAEIGKVLVDEALGVVRAIPYGVRALRLHRSLPDAVAGARDARGVRIVRDVRYASAPRAVMDVYLPDGASLANGAGAIADAVGGRGGGGGGGGGDSDSSAFPVALFVHGGVWAVGEKWHFAPMASRLAEEGVIACVATYTLFPRAEADQMWREVSDAVGFTLENARGFGGDDARVSLIGHSAGAHVCSMALLHRCGVVSDDVGGGASADDPAARRMPKQFLGLFLAFLFAHPSRSIPALGAFQLLHLTPFNSTPTFARMEWPLGLCGVYDVGRHYEYEDSRGVALLSTMGRAMGGREKFPQCSPVRVVRGNRGAVGGEYAYDVEDPQARSIRWSPYDRVGEVNAVP
ncbi:uncharacterized protein MICPUCDRAFT_52052 [Micromonas pusilla CCMP1545]|uniref:protein-S-isoprenylcysteine alpha-carbonyl methylesterase n=1 Tax=Micromonas pusilla (strain CCMP1545) TaxID=564608 RepID=C1N364_MICPC|nr:uncharacterized protein MICPUCDRAFT_52052 [Micromonas pusilla CCMP1545]EEH53145.1 predicted protein [Micromonas pusilla CCMP1545]|eukprot:XP_003062326.1 predicted protein [Micromonas pusilla CCMP1545]